MAKRKKIGVLLKGLYGCTMRKQNVRQYEEFLRRRGCRIVRRLGEADVIVLWTCAFREDVLTSSMKEVRRLAKLRSKRLIVAGCLPDIAPDILKRQYKGLVVTWRNDEAGFRELFGGEPGELDACRHVFAEPKYCDNAAAYRRRHRDADVTFADEYIKLVISEGCGYKCAYCSERLTFPPYKSFPEDELVAAARAVIRRTGEKRIMLLADSLGEYGKDTGTNLPKLIRRLCAIRPGVQVALNNLNAADLVRHWKPLTAYIRKGMICHLNLPIQSASARELRRMRRAYTRRDLDRIFSYLDKIGFDAYDTHIIVGFPGETPEDLQKTLGFLKTHKPRYALISRYMEMPHAPSAKYRPKVDRRTINRRLAEVLRQLSQAGVICNVEDGFLASERWARLRRVIS